MPGQPPAPVSRRQLLGHAAGLTVGGMLAACATSAPRGAARRDAGRLDRHPQFGSRHVAAREVVVWLPPGYDLGAERHAVLYMHDEQNLFDPNSGMGHGPWAVD